jgi:hypothetical protein
MPASYDRFGIHFDYPDNWEVDSSDEQGDPASVTVASPSGAFWTISRHPADANLGDLIDQVLSVLRDEYEQLDAKHVGQPLGDVELIGYDVDFYCLDFISDATIRGFQTPQATYVILCQAEDNEFQQFDLVFQAITVSLLRSLATASP